MVDFLNAVFPDLAAYPFLGATIAALISMKLFSHILDLWTALFRPRRW